LIDSGDRRKEELLSHGRILEPRVELSRNFAGRHEHGGLTTYNGLTVSLEKIKATMATF